MRNKMVIMGLALFVFVCSFSGCNRVLDSAMYPILHVDKGPFVPFTPLDFDFPSIDTPVLSWTYHWPEEYERTLEAACSPVVDEQGNIYIVGKNSYLYSLNPAGEVRWKKKGFHASIEVTKEGIVALARPERLVCLDFDGNLLWNISAMWVHGYDSLKLSPSGYLYFNEGEYVVCLDSQGKTKWAFHNLYGLAETLSFDEDSNVYMMGSRMYEKKNEQGIKEEQYVTSLVSISPQGKVRWSKVLCNHRNGIDEFTPKGSRIQDIILVAISTSTLNIGDSNESREEWYTDVRVQPKLIMAFNTEGEKIWERTEEKPGLFDIQYSVAPNGNAVYPFNVGSYRVDSDQSIPESEHHVLTCVSKDGSVVWNHSFEHAIHTPVTFDSKGNLYVGTVSPKNNDSIYSLSPDGQVRWELINIDTAHDYTHNLVGSPSSNLYFTTENQSLLFCIGES
jgi:outer membrane protein assembly factor BamB